MPYTIEESWAVVNETKRLCAEDARRGHHIVNVRASSTTKPPPPTTPTDLYFCELEKHLAKGLTVRQARRAVAIGQRHLLDAYLAEFSASSRAKTQAALESAAVARRRRNSH